MKMVDGVVVMAEPFRDTYDGSATRPELWENATKGRFSSGGCVALDVEEK